MASSDGGSAECPICTEVQKEPKLLPCTHSFCLKCLEQFVGKLTLQLWQADILPLRTFCPSIEWEVLPLHWRRKCLTLEAENISPNGGDVLPLLTQEGQGLTLLNVSSLLIKGTKWWPTGFPLDWLKSQPFFSFEAKKAIVLIRAKSFKHIPRKSG